MASPRAWHFLRAEILSWFSPYYALGGSWWTLDKCLLAAGHPLFPNPCKAVLTTQTLQLGTQPRPHTLLMVKQHLLTFKSVLCPYVRVRQAPRGNRTVRPAAGHVRKGGDSYSFPLFLSVQIATTGSFGFRTADQLHLLLG